jgi:hypothetical protein
MFKLKDIDYKIYTNPHEYELVDDEVVLYINDKDTIIALNATATFIWRYITVTCENGIDISDSGIVREIMDKYSYREELYEEILNDVTDVVQIFIAQGLIVLE